MCKLTLPKGAELIIDKLFEHGFRADAVGGCVRDMLRGEHPVDFDITTAAKPGQIKEIFKEYRTIDTGIAHGTVTVVVDGTPYEVTTYRQDGEYLDARHPSGVTFTCDLREDLVRRDFTVNAICYNARYGITDVCCGREDIERGIIRCVGDPDKRFSEDALRILRAMRFSATLGFVVEENTRAAMMRESRLILKVSGERIYTELKKLFSGKDCTRVVVEYWDIFRVIFPGLGELHSVDRLFPEGLDGEMKMVYIFGMYAEGDTFSSAVKMLHTDSAFAKLGCAALGLCEKMAGVSREGDLAALMTEAGDRELITALELAVSKGLIEEGYRKALLSLMSSGRPRRIRDLKIDGEKIKKIGLKGEQIGRVMKKLLFCAARQEVENDEAALCELAMKFAREVL